MGAAIIAVYLERERATETRALFDTTPAGHLMVKRFYTVTRGIWKTVWLRINRHPASVGPSVKGVRNTGWMADTLCVLDG